MLTLERPRLLHLAGGEIRILADQFDSDGQLELFEFNLPPTYAGPARHAHRKADELFMILEGVARFELGAETLCAKPGQRVLVQRGVPHRFSNASDGPLRMLCAFTPAIGMADYFPRLVELLRQSNGSPDPYDLAALWKRYDTLPA